MGHRDQHFIVDVGCVLTTLSSPHSFRPSRRVHKFQKPYLLFEDLAIYITSSQHRLRICFWNVWGRPWGAKCSIWGVKTVNRSPRWLLEMYPKSIRHRLALRMRSGIVLDQPLVSPERVAMLSRGTLLATVFGQRSKQVAPVSPKETPRSER